MFGKRITPLTYREVASALKRMGYVMEKKKSTAHEKWVFAFEGGRRVVIVDKHIAPFDKKLIKLMAQEARMSVSAFHAACKGQGVPVADLDPS